MPQKILVTNFTYTVTRAEFETMANQLAQAFADVPGCLWKIWLIDGEKKEAGAVYLFKDDASLQTFKSSPLVASVLSHPALSEFDLKEREILKAPSEITRAPLHSASAMAGAL
jgi:hypothetical protein